MSLSMTYHVCQLSVNLPLLANNNYTNPTSALTITAHGICNSSLDTMLSIFRRYKHQHSLQAVPLIFVQGAILAAETILARNTISHTGQNTLAQNTNLSVLDDVLGDMSSTWDIAGIARNELHRRIAQDAKNVPRPNLELNSIQSIEVGNKANTPDFCGSGSLVQIEGFDVGDVYDFNQVDFGIPLVWNPDLTVGQNLMWENVDLGKPLEKDFEFQFGYGLSQF